MRSSKRRQPSSIDRAGREVKELIGQLRIDHGWTIDEILKKLRELGQADISRSALGRHVKSLEEIGAQLRHSREVANALVQQLGDAPEDRTAELNIELMHTMILRLVTATNDEGDGQPITFDPEQVMFLTRSLQALAGAKKTNAETVLKVRQETAKDAAKKAVDAAKSKGLSADTVDFIRQAVLGSGG
jgi:hypothetical protein